VFDEKRAVAVMGAPLVMTLSMIINFYCVIIFVWVILSWFKSSSKIVTDIYNVLDTVASPYVNLFRKFIPPMGGLDISPLVALICLQLVARLLFGLLV